MECHGQFSIKTRHVASNGVITAQVPFTINAVYPLHIFEGWGPFLMLSVGHLIPNQIEIRLWSSGGYTNVYKLPLRPHKTKSRLILDVLPDVLTGMTLP